MDAENGKTNSEEREKRIHELKQEIIEMRERMPHHSVPPQMEYELMELEDELEQLRRET